MTESFVITNTQSGIISGLSQDNIVRLSDRSRYNEIQDDIQGAKDYADSIVSSAGNIYIKDNSLIIPNTGSFINSLDFSSSSYLQTKYKYEFEPFYAMTNSPVDLGATTGTFTLSYSYGILSITTDPTGSSDQRFIVNFGTPQPNVDYLVSIEIGTSTINAADVYVLNPIITNKNENGFIFFIRESAGFIQSLDKFHIKIENIMQGRVLSYQDQSNVDLSVGGAFALTSKPANTKLSELNLVIVGGTTSGTYKLV